MNELKLLGFTGTDGFLAYSCVAAAIIGSLIDYLIKREDFSSLGPESKVTLKFSRYMPLMLGRTFLGAAGGIAVYLLLLGSITLDKSGFAKLMILSAIAGFSAPAIAEKYKNKVPKVIEDTITSE